MIYVKFKHWQDIYAVDPHYHDRISCQVCGGKIFVHVSVPIEIIEPIGEIIKPLPKEAPHYEIRGISESPITLSVKRTLSLSEKEQLKSRYDNIVFIDSDGFEMLIDGYSPTPVECDNDNHIQRFEAIFNV